MLPKGYTILGVCRASYHLGMMYLAGNGVEQSFVKARELFTQAESDKDALFQLGKMTIKGQGGKKSLSNGSTLIEKSAKLGNSDAKAYLKKCAGFDW